MAYGVMGLEPEQFVPLFALDDEALKERGARRVWAEPGLPCRVALEDTAGGEELILLNYEHLARPDSPYRAKGPIFVGRNVPQARFTDALPRQIATRLLSLRTYDYDGIMVDAEVIEGCDADPLIRRFLARRDVAHVDAHFARRGCFGARIERA